MLGIPRVRDSKVLIDLDWSLIGDVSVRVTVELCTIRICLFYIEARVCWREAWPFLL